MTTLRIELEDEKYASTLLELLTQLRFVRHAEYLEDPERNAWLAAGNQRLQQAYTHEEPTYSVEDLQTENPDFSL